MAVLVQICNVFPDPRMGLDGVLAFQGQVLESSAGCWTAVLLQAHCLLTIRPIYMPMSLLYYYIVAHVFTLLWHYLFCFRNEIKVSSRTIWCVYFPPVSVARGSILSLKVRDRGGHMGSRADMASGDPPDSTLAPES